MAISSDETIFFKVATFGEEVVSFCSKVATFSSEPATFVTEGATYLPSKQVKDDGILQNNG